MIFCRSFSCGEVESRNRHAIMRMARHSRRSGRPLFPLPYFNSSKTDYLSSQRIDLAFTMMPSSYYTIVGWCGKYATDGEILVSICSTHEQVMEVYHRKTSVPRDQWTQMDYLVWQVEVDNDGDVTNRNLIAFTCDPDELP